MSPADRLLAAAPALLLLPLLLYLAARRAKGTRLLHAADATATVALAFLAPLLLSGLVLAGWLPDAPRWLLPTAWALALATLAATAPVRLRPPLQGAAQGLATALGLLAAGFLLAFATISHAHGGPLPRAAARLILTAGLLLLGAGLVDLLAPPTAGSRWRQRLLALLLPPLAWFALTQQGPALPPALPPGYTPQSPLS